MANKAAVALFLICCLSFSAHTYAVCTLVAGSLTFCLTNPCTITASILSTLCTVTGDPINITLPNAITVDFNVGTLLAIGGLSINANANAGATVNINSALTLANNLVLTGAAVVNTAQGTVIRVGGDLRVAAGATINVAGNVTVAGTTYVQGKLHLAGDLVQSSAQTAWVVATNSQVTLDGGVSGTAVLSGNGGIDASVTITANVTINAGNSPGAIFIKGDLTMSTTSTLEIEMVSGSNFDRLIIGGNFNRNGILYVDIEGSYRPSNGADFTFATHTGSSGSFILSRGNYDNTLNKISAQYNTADTRFQYGSATTVALPFALIALCLLGLVF